MNNTTLPAARIIDLSHQYDCAATMTVVTFVAHGFVHRARKFWRSDMPISGQVELYVIPTFPGSDYTSCTEFGWYDSTLNEEFLRYAEEGRGTVDNRAIELIAEVHAERAAVGSLIEAEQSARFAAIELH